MTAIWRRCVVRLALVVVVAGSLAALAPASALASYPWANEAALLNESDSVLRSTYVLDAGVGQRISRQVFASEPYQSFYTSHGFDRNFLIWAPLGSVGDPYASSHTWTGCRNPPDVPGSPGLQTVEPDGRRLCVGTAVASDPYAHLIRTDVQSGSLQGLVWDGVFLSDVCGNWSPANNAPKAGPAPTISGVKYDDLNGDGVREPGEPGLGGWTIQLLYNGSVVASTTTAADGSYSFTLNADTMPSIGAGTYTLREVDQTGWAQSQAPGSIVVDYGAGNSNFGGNDFGNYKLATISGRKFEDMNADGSGAGDPGLPNWTIDYTGKASGAVTTGSDGSYEITGLAPGTYTISEEQQPGWTQSAPASGTYTVTVQSGDNLSGLDFGNWRPATIQGRKFDDHDVDGSGSGDPGIPNWTLTLSDGSTTTTGSDGSYSFTGLKPGTYTVGERQQPGWRQTAPAGGTTTVTVTSGEVLRSVDFGNVCLGNIAVTAPAGVGVQVDEVNVPGILTNDPPLPRTASGTATISGLLPGTYRVTLTLPDGVFTTDPDLTALNGGFAIIKTVTVAECQTTTIAPQFVTSTSGKVTGGSVSILLPGGIGTAGFEFMQTADGPRGTLEYNDHATGLRIHTSDIQAIYISGTDAYIFGAATVGSTMYPFRLHVVDAGEPGTNDKFELQVANGYSAGLGETLAGGNIQIH